MIATRTEQLETAIAALLAEEVSPIFSPLPNRKNFRDITGRRFGRLVVKGFDAYRDQKACWWCICDCGNWWNGQGRSLQAGNTTSCGCYKLDAVRAPLTHGKTGTPEHEAWTGMKGRCNNPNNSEYPRYGGRGIKVCKRWMDAFENFFADMGERPGSGYSIERRDNNGNYEPSNCKWATRIEQANNRRTSRFITFRGRRQTLTQWCRELGLKFDLSRHRLNAGWSTQKVLGGGE